MILANLRSKSKFGGENSSLILLLVAIAMVFAPVTGAHARKASVYTVAKVKLDVRAKNAVVAKRKALKKGPLQALKLIFKRLAPFRAYDRLETLTHADANAVIEGFAVRSERNSSTRYLALLDYSFSRRKVQSLLSKRGVPFFDGRSQKQAILPVFLTLEEGQDSSQNRQNTRNKRNWFRAWRTIDMKHALTNTRLLTAKKVDQESWQKIKAGEIEKFGELQARHSQRRLILIDAQLNEDKDKLILHMFGADGRGQIDYKQEIPVTQDLRKDYQMVAVLAFHILEGRWREPQITGEVVAVAAYGADEAGNAGRRLVQETVFLRVSFRGLRDWQQIRKRLQRLPGVQKMQVNSLSPRGADVRISYPGGANRLQTQLAAYGFSLDQQGGDLVLRSTR